VPRSSIYFHFYPLIIPRVKPFAVLPVKGIPRFAIVVVIIDKIVVVTAAAVEYWLK
jgi:hypothetical protein